jgi:nicotinamide-nucleotide adenylyltransferase
VSPDEALAPAPKDEVTHPDPAPGPYTARLLLYAARNADKTPGGLDATPTQRAELMLAQAEAMPTQAGPVAVAIVAQPTFVAKAKALVRLLEESGIFPPGHDHEPPRQRSEPSTPLRAFTPLSPASPATPGTPALTPPPAITFLVGMDTLVRIFDAKYYPPGGMEAAMEELFAHAWLVCARRGSGGESTDAADTRRQEDALLARADVARWVARGRIRLIRAPESVADVSSTRVRMALRMGAGAGALRGLCADPVAKYLLEQRLYRG